MIEFAFITLSIGLFLLLYLYGELSREIGYLNGRHRKDYQELASSILVCKNIIYDLNESVVNSSKIQHDIVDKLDEAIDKIANLETTDKDEEIKFMIQRSRENLKRQLEHPLMKRMGTDITEEDDEI